MVRFQVYTGAVVQITAVFWVFTPRSVFALFRRFERTHKLYLKGERIWFRPMLKCCKYPPELESTSHSQN